MSTRQDAVLSAAMKRVEAVITERRKIEDAIETTLTEIPKAETALQQALEKLGTAEAEALLGTTTAPPPAETQQAVVFARMRLDSLSARLDALRSKLVGSEDGVIAAASEMNRAKYEYAQSVLADFLVDYGCAAEAFSGVARRGQAICDALGVANMQTRLRETLIPDLQSSLGRLVDFTRPYAADAKAAALFEQLSPIREAEAAIGGIVKKIQRSRESERPKNVPSVTVRGPEGGATVTSL